MADYRDKPTWALLLSSDLPEGSEERVLKMLGSVVSDFEHPLNEIIERQTKGKEQELAGVMKVEDGDFHSIAEGLKNDEVRMQLTEVVRAKVGSGKANEQDVSSKTVITRTLQNHKRFFEEIEKQSGAEMLKMIKDNPRKDTPYALMIVGIKTCIDSKISSTTECSSQVDVGVKIPLDQALKSAGIVLPVDTSIDLSMVKDAFAKVFTEYSAKGERIFAIQYRRISVQVTTKFRLLPKKQRKTKYGDLHTVPSNRGLFGDSDQADQAGQAGQAASNADEQTGKDDHAEEPDKLELGTGLDQTFSRPGEVYIVEL
jgi:hypothetical protein